MNDKSWPERFKAMKALIKPKLTNKKIAEITGNTSTSIDTVTTKKDDFPRWAKLAIWIAEYFRNLKGYSEEDMEKCFEAGRKRGNYEGYHQTQDEEDGNWKPPTFKKFMSEYKDN